MKINPKFAGIGSIILLMILIVAFSSSSNSEESWPELKAYNISEDFNRLNNNINSIQIPSCPACNCPKYEPVTCEPTTCETKTVIQKDTNLALDKFQFRYQQFTEDYYLLMDKIEDNNDLTYCKQGIIDLRDDLTLTYTYVADYMTDVSDADTKYAYNILVEGNDFFDSYLMDVSNYCNAHKPKIMDENYLRYFTYIEYYNNLSVNTGLVRVAKLDQIDEYD